jgi:hypothetical protein
MASDSAGIKMDMQRKNRKDRKFLASIVFVMMLLSFAPMVALHAQQAARGRGGPPAGPVKRRPDGKPDISGYYNSPNAGGAAFNVEAGPAAVGQPATQGAITDPPDKLIPYTTAAKAKREELLAHHLYDDPEAHCLPSGIPRQTYAPFGWQILQPDGYVVMIYEAFHAYRILPLDGRPHLPANVRLWEGDGRAHWDGDTLVIDTTNQTGKQWFDMAGNFSTPTLHVVEKFTPVDSNTLNWEATMDDPAVYTRPWTISARITKNNTPNYQILEFACHEGEQDLIHYTQEEGNPTGGKARKK